MAPVVVPPRVCALSSLRRAGGASSAACTWVLVESSHHPRSPSQRTAGRSSSHRRAERVRAHTNGTWGRMVHSACAAASRHRPPTPLDLRMANRPGSSHSGTRIKHLSRFLRYAASQSGTC
eukprot:scaffold4964_cov122-Isochrysis_galbana.AAC.7